MLRWLFPKASSARKSNRDPKEGVPLLRKTRASEQKEKQAAASRVFEQRRDAAAQAQLKMRVAHRAQAERVIAERMEAKAVLQRPLTSGLAKQQVAAQEALEKYLARNKAGSMEDTQNDAQNREKEIRSKVIPLFFHSSNPLFDPEVKANFEKVDRICEFWNQKYKLLDEPQEMKKGNQTDDDFVIIQGPTR